MWQSVKSFGELNVEFAPGPAAYLYSLECTFNNAPIGDIVQVEVQ